jgi:hypothetical protein
MHGDCRTHREMTNAYKIWLENQKGWDHSENLDIDGDNIRTDLREIGWEGVDWMYLARDRDQRRAVVNTIMNLLVSIKGEEFLDYLSDS